MDILVQVIGAIGYLALAISYFNKEKIKILYMQIIANILLIIHYYLLDGITGSICSLLGLITLIIIYLFDKYNAKNKKLLIICIIPFVIVIALFTYQNIYSILPIIASAITIFSFTTSSENLIRGIGIVAAGCWLIYAVVYHSYVAIVFESIILVFVLIAYIKNAKLKSNKNE